MEHTDEQTAANGLPQENGAEDNEADKTEEDHKEGEEQPEEEEAGRTRSSSASKEPISTSAASATRGRRTYAVKAAKQSTTGCIARSVAPSPTAMIGRGRASRSTTTRFPSPVASGDAGS